MATSTEVLPKLIADGESKGIHVPDVPVPEAILRQQAPVCQQIYQGVVDYCKGTDQISMIPMQYIQLGAYAGMLAAAWQRKHPSALEKEDFPRILMAGRRAEELASTIISATSISRHCWRPAIMERHPWTRPISMKRREECTGTGHSLPKVWCHELRKMIRNDGLFRQKIDRN